MDDASTSGEKWYLSGPKYVCVLPQVMAKKGSILDCGVELPVQRMSAVFFPEHAVDNPPCTDAAITYSDRRDNFTQQLFRRSLCL